LYNLLAGYYTVSVTDINNCGPFSQEITLSSPSELTIQMSVVSDYNGFHLSCFNSSDGQALATPNGGLPPYLYSWTDQSSAELSAIDLSAGTVFCQVVDQNGCQSIGQIEIVPPPPLQQTVSVVSDYNGSQISCFDSFDGSAQVATVGGTGIYQHQWSNGQTGTVSINLEPIGYWVESTDENECEILTSFTILPPDTLEVMPYITSNYNGSPISCYQQSDAVVSAIVVGGTGAYQVTWQTQNQSGVGNVASGLPSGSITFLIMDENGCSVSETIDIDEPDELILSLNVLSDYSGFGVSCSGSQNGFIAALVSGGTGDFAVTWSNGQEGFINESLGGGMYSAQVTDENGCVSDELIVEITEPDELIVSDYFHSIYNGFGVSCYGADDGWIALTTTGGVEPINFAWSNGELTEDLTDISAGYYNCQILDANLCQTNQIVVLNEPNEIDLQFEYVKDFCSLGTGIFQPSFNGVVGQTTVYIDGVMQPDGMSQYCCFTGNDQILFSVEDENGCQGDSIFIFPNIEAPVINLNVLSNNNVCEDFTKVQLIPSSNYYPVWYSIPGHQNLEILDEYSLLIQITSFGTVPIEVIGEIYPGCSSTGNVEIEVLPTMKVFVPNSFTPGSDNVNDGFFIVGENIEHLEWTIFDRWGGVMHVNNEVKGYWNGTNQNNGLDCIQGVYQYTYRAESYCGEVKEGRGHIVLLR
jgi:gliding motility-associated-like protein